MMLDTLEIALSQGDKQFDLESEMQTANPIALTKPMDCLGLASSSVVIKRKCRFRR